MMVYFMKREKKVTWSKGILLCSCLIFISVVVLVFWLYISGNIKNMYDVTLLATLVTVTGGIFGSNLVWYSKKAGSENQYKLRMGMYEESARVRLDYNEKMMQMKRKYEMNEDDIVELDSSGNMDEFMEAALSNTITGLDETQMEFDSPNTLETY